MWLSVAEEEERRFPSSTTDAIIDRKLVHSTTTHLSPVDDVGLTGTGLGVRSLVA